MPIKNYTSKASVEASLTRIETALAKFGATGISKEYHDGQVHALCFRVAIPGTGNPIEVRLPTNHKAVFEALWKDVIRARDGTRKKIEDQAFRTSWRLMQDWVEVQLSLIRMRQVEILQVFLPYVWNGKVTFYESLKLDKFRALPKPE